MNRSSAFSTQVRFHLQLSIAILGTFGLRGNVTLQAEMPEGFAEPYRQIEITAASEPGLITDIRVKEGEAVTSGQILAAMDTTVLEATLKIAQQRSQFDGRLKAAQAEHRMQRDRLEKLVQLQSKGHASPSEIERATADVAVTEAQIILANEERQLAALECQRIKAQIEQRRFRSPIDGVVVEVVREIGESAHMGDPQMMTLVQLHPLRVKFPVPVSQSNHFSAGDNVRINLPERQASIDALVEVVAPVLDPKSGTVEVSCIIDNSTGDYRSGMRCILQVPGISATASQDTFDSFSQRP